MVMKNILKPLACICMIALTGQLQAQITDKVYQDQAGNFALAYNGIAEKGYHTGYTNTPYYPETYTEGSFVFRDMEYHDVKMRLDCYTKRLVVLTPDGKLNRLMHPEEVGRATIGGIPFVYFDKAEAAPGEGYYAALYEGKNFSIYRLHYVNNLMRETHGRVMRLGFSLKERVYLVQENRWTLLKGKNSFIRCFKDHKKALGDYCRKNGLRFGSGNRSDWAALAAYCETLMKE